MDSDSEPGKYDGMGDRSNEDIEKMIDYMISASKERLAAYRRDMEISFNAPYTEQLPEDKLPPPEWFPRPNIYGKLMQAYYESFEKLKQAKQDINSAINKLRSMDTQSKKSDADELIEKLREEQKMLYSKKQELLNMNQNVSGRKNYYDSEIRKYEMKLQELTEQINSENNEKLKLENTLTSCMEELEKIYKENNAYIETLKKSTIEVEKLHKSLNERQAEAANFVNQRNELRAKNNQLQEKVKELETERVEAEYKIKHHKELLVDHDQMIAAFDLAKKQLQREEAMESAAIAKMQEAVDSAEESKDEAQRLKREANSIKEEVSRAKQTLSETLVNLKNGAKRKIDQINQNYETKILEADKQFSQLLNDNSQLTTSLETMRRQLSFLESQNSVLRSDDGKGRTAFEEFGRGARAQLEMLNGQLEDLARENQRLKDEEQRQKSKLAASETERDNANSAVRKQITKLEAEFAQVKASLSEAEAAGSALLAENGRLEAELTRTSVDSKQDIESKLAEKDNEIRRLQARLDEARRAHIARAGELQQILLENKRFADRCKEAAEKAAIQSEQSIEDTEKQAQQYAQKAAALVAEIERQESEASQLQQCIVQKQQEVRECHTQYEAIERRVFDQKTQLDSLYEQQLQFATQREQTQNEIDKKKIELKRLKREYKAKSKFVEKKQ